MRVNILAAGSRGDVQPMVALGVGLQRAGHEVTVCAGDDFEPLVTSHGVGFAPAGVRIEELIASPLGVAWLGESSRSPWHELAALRRFVRSTVEEYAGAWLPLVGSADLWVSGMLTVHAADALASAGGGRHVSTEFAPVRPTREGTAGLQPVLPRRSSVLNVLAAQVLQATVASVFAPPGDQVRRELGLPATGTRGMLDAMRRTPALLAASPLVVPPAPDWHGDPEVTGYWFLDDDPGFVPDDALATWVGEGRRTAYVGFGSMSTSEARHLGELVAVAARAARVRVVLHSGSAGLASHDDTWVHSVGSVPHGWLLPRTAGVVHHGGAGTTAAALRAGVPQAVVAHIGDQPYWGRRVWELGVGARPVRRHELSVEWLTEVLRGFARGVSAERAAVVGAAIRAEDGVGRAVEALTRP
ncbi:glycosyl transferase [Knoellia flava TL1]|uniref:Glycosyl transferase n=2 Tax=Knoellia flava TaxID=913969 RepID=A0A8H9FX04_9MICO|nr:glycosyltransferase [Knoellia flava]KGN32219.1 glycosyl transferase [Knoellia flava TL1]GGB89693.1 glycosyl transferase [Knoellia flava]